VAAGGTDGEGDCHRSDQKFVLNGAAIRARGNNQPDRPLLKAFQPARDPASSRITKHVEIDSFTFKSGVGALTTFDAIQRKQRA